MRFKTDENLHPDLAAFIRRQGHEAVTVWDQGLQGVPDEELAEVCRVEGRALVTLDLDFADIRAYPPERYSGLVVLRGARQDRRYVVEMFGRVVRMLEHEPLAKHLWIVDQQSVRIHGKDEQAEE